MLLLRYFLCMLLTFYMIACGGEGDDDSIPEGRILEYSATVSFLSVDGDTISTLKAAVADDTATRSSGLMNVYDLPSDRGMLFIFDNEEPRSFWMANTPLALDIIFVNSNMEIIRIHQNTRPYSNRNVESELSAQYVVETNAGYTLRHDIIEGMKIAFDYDNNI